MWGKKTVLMSLLSLVSLCALVGMYGVYVHTATGAEVLAQQVVVECAKEEGSTRDLCYEKEIPALMDHGVSMDEAYAITVLVQEMDPSYQYCHVLAHNISAKETAKDPSKWKDIIAHVPAGMCGNGALHGAFQERFRSTSLPDASVAEVETMVDGACDLRDGWNPTLIERSSCMHGMGHLLVYITDANISKSLALCDVLGRAKNPGVDFVETCYEGVFMQIYQPLEPEDVGLVAALTPASKHRVSFCGRFSGLAHATCIKESWPVVDRDSLMTPAGFESVCAPLSGLEGYDNCVRGLVFVVMGMKEYDSVSMLHLCSQLPTKSVRDICVGRTAVRFIETDWKNIPQALKVCTDSSAEQDACWKELIGYAQQGMRPDSVQTKALCSGVADTWKSTCLEQTGTAL